MLKATFTKIKTACVIALVPRIIRGDGRYTTKKFGKSSINILRKAGKSTDSGSKDGDKECDKCNRIIEFVFGENKSKPDDASKLKNKAAVTNIQEHNKNEIFQAPKNILKPESRNKKRNNRLLKDFVGVDEDVVRKDHDLNRNVLFKAAAPEKPTLVQSKGNLNDLGKKTSVAMPLTEDTEENNADAECKRSLSKRKEFEKRSQAVGYDNKRTNSHNADVPDHIPATNYKLQATTAKQKEEKLTQKIEDIDEIPHVETSTSKVDGMNVSPNILGDRFINFSGSTYRKSKSDFQDSLDEIAKKCMNVPANQIDKKLMQEMEQMGLPNTNEKSLMDEDVVQMDRLKKPEKPLHEVEIDFDTREDKREPINCIEHEKLSPSFEMPPNLNKSSANRENRVESICRESTRKFGEQKKESASTISIQESILGNNDSMPQFDINKPLIDPYGKKTLAFNSDEFEEAVVDSKMLDDQRIGKPSQNEENRDQTFAETYVTSSGVTELESSERAKDLDHVQSMYNCAPRELNWRPYPSFEAREEVIDFYKQREESRDNLKLIHTEPTIHMNSEPEPEHELEQLYEPRPERIYTSTSVSSESKEQISHSFVQPQEMINPLMDKSIDLLQEIEEKEESNDKDLPDTIETLPSLKPDGNVPLTELLRRVRMRNRQEYCREFALHTLNVHAPETLPTEGKCGKKTPPCPPPPPKCPPPSPCPPKPPACPPPPPPCPKPCKPMCPACPPPKKNPCNKFKKKCEGASIREVLTLLAQSNTQKKIPQKYFLPVLVYKTVNNSEPAVPEENLLNDNLVFRLSVLGKILLFHCTEAIDANLPRNRSELRFARDFEPWTPIPSWPIPKKEEKNRFVCPKEGCKVFPPPKLNAPCKENPCLNFPKRSNFSLTDLFSFSLVESLLYRNA